MEYEIDREWLWKQEGNKLKARTLLAHRALERKKSLLTGLWLLCFHSSFPQEICMKRHCPWVKCISFTFLLYQIITILAVLNRTCLSYLWRSESERVFLSKNQAVKSLCSRVTTLADPFPSLCRVPEAILTSWFTASYHLQSYQWPGNSFVQCHLSSLVSFASSSRRYLQLQ